MMILIIRWVKPAALFFDQSIAGIMEIKLSAKQISIAGSFNCRVQGH
jgi:hypothetical protein